MTTESTEDDPRLLAAAQEYLAELEAGRRPDRQQLAARHPGLAGLLDPYLDALDLVHAAGPALPIHPTHRLPPSWPSLPPEPLGDFRIVREIGRGGMGIVYEAVQLSLGRRVALKVLPLAAGLNPRQLQRFQTEAHAAAQLHHTNIVPVYAVGCERGVHYYAMQLIDGQSLDAIIASLRGEKPEPTPFATTLDLRAGPTATASRPGSDSGTVATREAGHDHYRMVATLALQVADALEYAHEAGVIHRDIKPANLLRDTRGTVWVTDFGLAQVTAQAGLTQTGDVFGTLRYMSPEQAAGRRVEVDHRTDIYSLGATLYELLSLQPVFPAQDRQKLLHQILHEEPRPLRHLDPRIPVELETIVAKTLAKSPADRYGTAGELAADLRRFLDDRPILARPPTWADRARKWIRRHPATVRAAVLLLIGGVVALGVSTALIAAAHARTQEALDGERLRAAEAEHRFQLARRSADEMIRIAEDELANNPEMEGLRKRLLESSLAYYQELIDLRRDDPAAQAELAVTRDRVRQIVADLAVLQGDRHLFLLDQPAVLEDLRLTPVQRDRIAELSQRIRRGREESAREFHRLSAEERSRRFLEQARAHDAAVAEILTPEQLARFRQVSLQTRGPSVFRDPEVVAALRLTGEQRNRIRAIETEELFGRDWPRRGPDPRRRIDLPGIMDRMLMILTPEQLARWQELTGEPFAGPRLLYPGPPRSFGPPAGPPPGPKPTRFP